MYHLSGVGRRVFGSNYRRVILRVTKLGTGITYAQQAFLPPFRDSDQSEITTTLSTSPGPLLKSGTSPTRLRKGEGEADSPKSSHPGDALFCAVLRFSFLLLLPPTDFSAVTSVPPSRGTRRPCGSSGCAKGSCGGQFGCSAPTFFRR
ncbi:uncharacterized protein PHA67_020642 [Liasis olivaceus]